MEINENINSIRFRTSKNMFTNSQCLFVEYEDIINLPYLMFLSFFMKSETANTFFELDKIKYLDSSSLIGYYLRREYRNPLVDLLKDKKFINFDALNEYLYTQLYSDSDESYAFFNPDIHTNFYAILYNLMSNKIVNKIVIYVPKRTRAVENDIFTKFTFKPTIIDGSFEEALKDIPNDTTYVFSDCNKITTLVDMDKINLSAILLATDYRYNYTDNKKEKFLIDMSTLSTRYNFKWGECLVN